MLISRYLHKKRSEVSIKRRSTPASLSFKGRATEHTTVKWPIQIKPNFFFSLWEGKTGVPEKTLSERSREPTNSTHVWCWGWNWTLASLVEGEWFHHGNNSALNEAFCSWKISLSFLFDRTVLSGFNQVFPSKLLLWSCMVRYALGSLSCCG